MRKWGFILAIAVGVVFSFLSVDGHAKKPTSAGSGGVSLSDLSCAANEIAKFDGTVWACAADETGSLGGLADLNCTANEIAKFNGTVWICAADNTGSDTLSGLQCQVDQIAKFDGAVWVCADDNSGSADNVGAAAAPSYVLRDAGGLQVGTVTSVEPIWVEYDVFTLITVSNSSAVDHEIILTAYPEELWGGAPVYFDGVDCTGNSFLRTDRGFLPALSPHAVVRSDGINLNLWIPASNVVQTVATNSRLFRSGDGSRCTNETETLDVLPAEIGVTDLHTLYPPPFTLEKI